MQVKRITFINKRAASKEASEPHARATPQEASERRATTTATATAMTAKLKPKPKLQYKLKVC
jgi:hypothetical protein